MSPPNARMHVSLFIFTIALIWFWPQAFLPLGKFTTFYSIRLHLGENCAPISRQCNCSFWKMNLSSLFYPTANKTEHNKAKKYWIFNKSSTHQQIDKIIAPNSHTNAQRDVCSPFATQCNNHNTPINDKSLAILLRHVMHFYCIWIQMMRVGGVCVCVTVCLCDKNRKFINFLRGRVRQ